MNSDDLLVEGTLEAVDRAFAEPGLEVVSGGVEFFESAENSAPGTLYSECRPERLEFSLQQVLSGMPAINARFFQRELLERQGAFDLRYRRVPAAI